MSADALRTTAALVPALAAAPRDALVENVHTAVMAKMELADIDQDVKVCQYHYYYYHHHHHHHYIIIVVIHPTFYSMIGSSHFLFRTRVGIGG